MLKPDAAGPARPSIRAAVASDVTALSLVGSATFLESFAGAVDGADVVAHCRRQHAEGIYTAWLSDPAFKLWLATVEPGEAPVGYAVLGPAELPIKGLSRDDWEVKRVYVLSRFHGGGVGRRLIELAKSEARQRGGRRLLVGVYAENAGAISFYRRVGFEEIGTREFLVGTRRYHDLVFSMELSTTA